MFTAKFVSSSTFVSKKSGEPCYRIELIADTLGGETKILQEFCTANAYEQSKNLQSMQACKVGCAVSDNGFITIHGVKGE